MNKKHITMIAGASMLVLGFPAISMAQGTAASGPFADVPADHWAYASVDTLQKAGIVIGYPDGTFGGKRAMSRYEFAVAIARLLPLLKQDNSNYATKDDLAALKSDLQSKLQANSDAIDALKKLVDEFQPELQKLGQDVAAVKDRLDALEARVAAVEEEQRRVKFNGALNIIAKGENVTKGPGFVDENGDPLGFGGTANKHILQTTDVYQDFLLSIKGKVSDTATANVKLDFGNYLSALGNTAAGIAFPAGGGPAGTPVGALSAANEATSVWEANIATPVNLGPLGGADLVAGRFGNQWTNYTLKQIDADVYTNLYQTDSGNITTDGAKVDLNLGHFKVDAWAGQFKAVQFSQPYGGSGVAPVGGLNTNGTIGAGLLPEVAANALNQGAGARATIGNPANWVLGASVEQFGTAATGVDANNGLNYNDLSVYGLDFNGALPLLKSTGLKLDANWTDAAEGTNSHSFNDIGNGWRYESTDDQLALQLGALSLKGGYQYVGPNFSAPGSWGRLGSWINPTNIEGGVGSAKYVFSPKLTANADYEAYKSAYGATSGGGFVQSPLQGGDKANRYQVGVAYGLTSNYDVDLGYEEVDYKLGTARPLGTGGSKPTQSLLTIGVGHTFNQNASFKLLYQVDTYKDKNSGFDGGVGDLTGNVAVGQFQVKF